MIQAAPSSPAPDDVWSVAREAYLAALADALDEFHLARPPPGHRLQLPQQPLSVKLLPPTSSG